MKVNYLLIAIIICANMHAMEQNFDAGAPESAAIQPSVPTHNVRNTNQVSPTTVEEMKATYKQLLIKQKAYELAQTYLYASPGRIADWSKVAAIVYQAGYNLAISHGKLSTVVANLLLNTNYQINNLKMFWDEKINCALLETDVNEEWKTARSAYENATYSMLQD